MFALNHRNHSVLHLFLNIITVFKPRQEISISLFHSLSVHGREEANHAAHFTE